MPISDMYIGENKSFTATTTYNGSIPSSSNVVSMIVKENIADDDADAVLTKSASVSVNSTMASSFTITPDDTDEITPGTYVCELRWTHTANNINKVLLLQQLNIKERVYDI